MVVLEGRCTVNQVSWQLFEIYVSYFIAEVAKDELFFLVGQSQVTCIFQGGMIHS